MPFVEHFPQLITWWNVALLISGTAGGLILGTMPGMNGAILLALLLPFTTDMTDSASLVLLGSVYAATATIDAAGRYRLAACIGAMAGVALLIFAAPALEQLATSFQPGELVWAAILTIVTASALGARTFTAGLIAGGFGAWLSTVGHDGIAGGSGGSGLVTALVGLLVIPAAIKLIRDPCNPPTRGIGRAEYPVVASGLGGGRAGALLIPLLTLGMPGSASAAALLAALLTRGLFPGPDLFTVHAGAVGPFIGALALALVLLLAFGPCASHPRRLFAHLPARRAGFALVVLAVIGLGGHVTDVLVALALGVTMYVTGKAGLAIAPVVVIGFAIGPFAQSNLRQGRMIADSLNGVLAYFCGGRINPVLIALCLLLAAYGVLRDIRAVRRAITKDSSGA